MTSSTFQQKVDTLVADLLFAPTADPRNVREIVERGKRDRGLIIDILKGLKIFDDYSVQSDWNQIDTLAPDFIKNKPTSLGGGTNSNVLIDCGSYLAPNDNVLIECGSYL